MTRYRYKNGFGDGTDYVEVRDDGSAVCVGKDGSEGITGSKEWCERNVASGAWIKLDDPPSDPHVDAPPHYTQGDIECIDAIRAALTDEEFRGYCKGNVLSYVWREKMKGGDQDLKKAQAYLKFIDVKVKMAAVKPTTTLGNGASNAVD